MPEAPLTDDPSIPNNELLYHRVYPDPHGIYIEPTSREPRPTSGAFRSKGPEPLSVDLASLTTPEESLSRARLPGLYLAVVRAGVIRGAATGCGMLREAYPGNVARSPARRLRTRARCRRLVRRTTRPSRPRCRPFTSPGRLSASRTATPSLCSTTGRVSGYGSTGLTAQRRGKLSAPWPSSSQVRWF